MKKGVDMLHLLRRATWIALLLALALQGEAFAATVEVAMSDFVFTPGTANLRMGDSVHWTNDGPSPHTATGNAPLSLFDTGVLFTGDDFTFAFTAAGVYRYFCEIHPDMLGSVRIKPKASPPSGPVGTLFRVRVATVPAGADFVYDVQKRNPGGGFTDWMIGITSSIANFDSTGMPTGTYQFRSRLRRVSNGGASQYSQATSISVTA
jgi:plastocyanin